MIITLSGVTSRVSKLVEFNMNIHGTNLNIMCARRSRVLLKNVRFDFQRIEIFLFVFLS